MHGKPIPRNLTIDFYQGRLYNICLLYTSHMRGGKRLFLREYRLPLRARDGALLQDFVKTLAVLRRVHKNTLLPGRR